jgi:hypothetical protein
MSRSWFLVFGFWFLVFDQIQPEIVSGHEFIRASRAPCFVIPSEPDFRNAE